MIFIQLIFNGYSGNMKHSGDVKVTYRGYLGDIYDKFKGGSKDSFEHSEEIYDTLK